MNFKNIIWFSKRYLTLSCYETLELLLLILLLLLLFINIVFYFTEHFCIVWFILETPCKRKHQQSKLCATLLLPSTSFILSFIVVMASKSDKDDYIYDVANLSALMASMDADGAKPDACPKKSKRLEAKTAGKSTEIQPLPASSIESLLELERVKNENLKIELEVTKAQLELAKMKSFCITADSFFRKATPCYRLLSLPLLEVPLDQAS